MYIHMYICIYVYMYICTETERGREGMRKREMERILKSDGIGQFFVERGNSSSIIIIALDCTHIT